jgi:hypothetical protein
MGKAIRGHSCVGVDVELALVNQIALTLMLQGPLMNIVHCPYCVTDLVCAYYHL